MLGYLNSIEEEAVNKLKSLLSLRLGNSFKSLLLYGSKARGDYNKESDIDILVVADTIAPEVKDAIRETVLDIQLEYDLPIAVHIRSFDYISIQKGNPLNLFIRSIEREGIRV